MKKIPIAVTGALFAFALDYKGDAGGGGGAQYIYTAIAFASALFLALRLIGHSVITASLRGAFYILFYALFSIAVGLVSGNGVEYVVKMGGLYFLIVIGVLAWNVAFLERVSPVQLWNRLFLSIAVATVFRFIFASAVQGVELETARYQILAPSLPIAIVYVALRVFSARTLFSIWVLCAIGLLIPVVLSLTRIYLLTVAVSYVATYFLIRALPGSAESVAKRYSPVVVAVLGGLGLAVVFSVASFGRAGALDAWTTRVSNQAGGVTIRDVTLLTRQSEYYGMIGALNSTPWRYICGYGVGAAYIWDTRYADELRLVFSDVNDLYVPYTHTGHSMWFYALYTGGIGGFFLHLWLMAWIPIRGGILLVYRKRLLFGAGIDFTFPFLALLGVVSQSFTANPIGDRLTDVCAGVLIGAAIDGVSLLRASKVE